jgi:hypothetical protein
MSRIAVVNVGLAREKVFSESDDRRNIQFKHDPSKEDPSHSGIFNSCLGLIPLSLLRKAYSL